MSLCRSPLPAICSDRVVPQLRRQWQHTQMRTKQKRDTKKKGGEQKGKHASSFNCVSEGPSGRYYPDIWRNLAPVCSWKHVRSVSCVSTEAWNPPLGWNLANFMEQSLNDPFTLSAFWWLCPDRHLMSSCIYSSTVQGTDNWLSRF